MVQRLTSVPAMALGSGLAIVCVMGGTTVHADIMIGETVELEVQDFGPDREVQYSFDGASGKLRAGIVKWNTGIETFCIQLREFAPMNPVQAFEVVELEAVPDSPPLPGQMGELRATLIRDLYARWYVTMNEQVGLSAANHAAAFQMCIWELTHQESNALTATDLAKDMNILEGNARFDSTLETNEVAMSMLLSLGGGKDEFNDFQGLVGLTNPLLQDQLTVVPGAPGLAMLAGMTMGLRRRRSQRG